jgi:hypothetical protein
MVARLFCDIAPRVGKLAEEGLRVFEKRNARNPFCRCRYHHNMNLKGWCENGGFRKKIRQRKN